MIIASCGIIVEDACDKLHEVDDVIGCAFEEDTTYCHMAVPGTKLVWCYQTMGCGLFHHLVTPNDSKSHVQGSTK